MSLNFKKFFVVFAGVTLLMNGAMLGVALSAENVTIIEQQASGGTVKGDLEAIGCGGASGLWPSCWMAVTTYSVLYLPAVGLLTLSGWIFDFMMALSIDKKFIEQQFVKDTWKVVRDFSNMIFIFILLYTGIQTILFGAKWQGTVTKVVVIALIINFSMFFTNVVIDAGNILAVGMYQSIGSEKKPAVDKAHTRKEQTVSERNITASLINALRPQSFAEHASKNKTLAPTIFIVAAIVCGYTAYIFFKAALLFMGRIIAFWFLIIIAPFAFASMTLPKGNIWSWWTSTLIKQAFVAPVFLFLIYLIMFAIGGGEPNGGILAAFGEIQSGSFFFDMIFVPIVVTGIIIYALKKALGVATDMSDEFGKIGMDALNKVVGSMPMGMAANVALGGGAGILRATVGQGAGKLLQSGGRLNKMATSDSKITGFIGRGLYGATEKAHKGTFDVRATGIAKTGLGAIKSGLGVGINLGQADKSGWDKIQKQREKDAKARAEKFNVSDTEKAIKGAAVNPEYPKAKAREEHDYQAERAAILEHAKAKESANNTDEGKRVAEGKVVYAETEAKQKVAKERADNSTASKSVKDAENSLKTMGSTAKTEGDRLVKAIERLKKDQAEAVKNGALGTAEGLNGEIEQAEKDKENAQRLADGAVKNAERELKDAKKAFDDSDEGKALADANKDLVDVGQKLKDAQKALDETAEGVALKVAEESLTSASATLKATRKIIKETDNEVKEWANSENERRRERIGRVETFGRLYYTKADRESFVKTVRAAKTKEQRSEDKEEKKALKLVRKAMKEATKEEGGDGKDGEKKEEKPKEEGGEKK